jgi:hypothetical protein
LHLIQQVFIQPAGYSSAVFVAGAFVFDLASPAGAGGIVLDLAILLGRLEAEGHDLPSRTPVAIGLWVIPEILLGKQPLLAIGGSIRFGDCGSDSLLKAGFDLGAVIVAFVGKDLELIYLEDLFSPSCHPFQLVEIVDFIGNIVIDDQFVLIVHADLDVVSHLRAVVLP